MTVDSATEAQNDRAGDIPLFCNHLPTYSSCPYLLIYTFLNTVTSSVYIAMVRSSHGKKADGRAARPRAVPRVVNGIIVKAAIPENEISIRGRDARLWMKGILGVRSMWMTNVCVHIDSTNQPAWNTAINAACIVGSVI